MFVKLKGIREKEIIYYSVKDEKVIKKLKDLLTSNSNFEMITFVTPLNDFKRYA